MVKHGFSAKLLNDDWDLIDIVRKKKLLNMKNQEHFFQLPIIKEIWKNP